MTSRTVATPCRAYSSPMRLAEALLALGQSDDSLEIGEAVMVVRKSIVDLQHEVRGLAKAVYLLTEAADPEVRDKAQAAYTAETNRF